MNTITSFLTVVSVAWLLLPPQAQSEDYALDWFVIGGGGDTSTNEVGHSLTGTIAQPDTSTLGGDGYLLQGGFWGVYGVIQSPGTPFLQLADQATNIFLSWQGAGFVLQRAANVVGPWSDASLGANVNGFDFEFRQKAFAPMEFFKLRPECVAFGSLAAGPLASSFTHQGLTFTSPVGLSLATREDRRFLTFTGRLRVDLPNPCSVAELTLSSTVDTGSITAFDSRDQRVGSLGLPPANTQPRAIRLTGTNVHYLVIEIPTGGGSLQGVCCPYP